MDTPTTSESSSLLSDDTDEEYDGFHECGAGLLGTEDDNKEEEDSSSSSCPSFKKQEQTSRAEPAFPSVAASKTKTRGKGSSGHVLSARTPSQKKTGKEKLELVYSASTTRGQEEKREGEPPLSCTSVADNKRGFQRTGRAKLSLESKTTRQEEAEKERLKLPSPPPPRLEGTGDKPALSSESDLRKPRRKQGKVFSASTSTRQEEAKYDRQGASSPSASTSHEETDDEPASSSKSTLTRKPGRRGRAKVPSALTSRRQELTKKQGLYKPSSSSTSTRQEETEVGHPLSSETTPTKKTGRGLQAKYFISACSRQEERKAETLECSPSLTSVGQDETDEEKLELPSSSFTSQTAKGDADPECHPLTATSKKQLKGGARAKAFSALTGKRQEKLNALTLTRQEDTENEVLEYPSEPRSTATNTEIGARPKISFPSKSARWQEEEWQRYECSYPSNVKRLQYTSPEELDISFGSASAPGVSSRGKVPAPKSTGLEDMERERPEISCIPTSARREEVGSDKPAQSVKKRGRGAKSNLSSASSSGRQHKEEAHAPQLSSPPTSSAVDDNKSLASRPRAPNKQTREFNELALIKEAEEVMKNAGIEVSHNPTKEGNSFFDEEVKLENDEKHFAFKRFHELHKQLMASLNNDNTALEWKDFKSGSSYDGTKVTKLDEIDVMFFPTKVSKEWLELVFHGAPPGFCFVKLRDMKETDPKYTELRQLCDRRNMCIKPGDFKDKLFECFRRGIKKTRHAIEAEPSSSTGVALRVEYNVIPAPTGKRPIYLDLVPALHFPEWPEELKHFHRKLPDAVRKAVEKVGFHVVPKSYPDGQYGENGDLLWRLSFSKAEKKITNYLDGKYRDPNSKDLPTCRKYILRMVKRIFEISKDAGNSRNRRACPSATDLKSAVAALRENRNVEIEYFCTYTIRTLLWDDFYVGLREDEAWQKSKWRTRLHDTLRGLKRMLTGEKAVYHFFVPTINIMDDVPMPEREFLYIIFWIAEKIF